MPSICSLKFQSFKENIFSGLKSTKLFLKSPPPSVSDTFRSSPPFQLSLPDAAVDISERDESAKLTDSSATIKLNRQELEDKEPEQQYEKVEKEFYKLFLDQAETNFLKTRFKNQTFQLDDV